MSPYQSLLKAERFFKNKAFFARIIGISRANLCSIEKRAEQGASIPPHIALKIEEATAGRILRCDLNPETYPLNNPDGFYDLLKKKYNLTKKVKK